MPAAVFIVTTASPVNAFDNVISITETCEKVFEYTNYPVRVYISIITISELKSPVMLKLPVLGLGYRVNAS